MNLWRIPQVLVVLLAIYGGLHLRFQSDMGIYTTYHNLPLQYKCENLGTDKNSPEHISYYNKSTIIVSKIGLLDLYFFQGADAPSGYIQIIANADTESPEVYTPELIGFPEGIKFHPFGHYYNQEINTLAVISPTFKYGGPRIELFSFTEKGSRLVLVHKRSVRLPFEKYMGNVNSIIMPSKDLIYFTTSVTETDGEEGKPFNPPSHMEMVVWKWFFHLRFAKVHRVDLKEDGTEDINEVAEGSFILANGINFDQEKRIYVVDSIAKTISIYNKEMTIIMKTLQFDFFIDNLVFDPTENKMYITGFQVTNDYFVLVGQVVQHKGVPDDADSWNVIWEMDTTRPTEEIDISACKKIMSEKGNIRGSSSSLRSGEYLYLGSWADKGPMRCQKV